MPTENQELREAVEKLRPNLPINYISEIEMGELFKVMPLTANFDHPLLGFKYARQIQ